MFLTPMIFKIEMLLFLVYGPVARCLSEGSESELFKKVFGSKYGTRNNWAFYGIAQREVLSLLQVICFCYGRETFGRRMKERCTEE
jgi:hypothetical protein